MASQPRGSSQDSAPEAALHDPLIATVRGQLLQAQLLSDTGSAPATFAPIELPPVAELSSWIDHTCLKADATRDEIRRVCEEATQYRFATVCVNGSFIPLVNELLQGSSVKPIAVVGFPLGAASTESKSFEAREAVRAGAQEIDKVLHVGALKSRDYRYVLEDIRRVVESSDPAPVKVILETASLTLEQKIIACLLSREAGAAFVKTSTGFGAGGATVEDVALMRRVVGNAMGVKASGGIRSYADAKRMILAGANRIGASASVAILQEAMTNEAAPVSSSGPSAPPVGSGLY